MRDTRAKFRIQMLQSAHLVVELTRESGGDCERVTARKYTGFVCVVDVGTKNECWKQTSGRTGRGYGAALQQMAYLNKYKKAAET